MCLVNCNVLSSVGMIRMTNSMTRMFCCLISTRLATSSPRFLLSSYTLIPLTQPGILQFLLKITNTLSLQQVHGWEREFPTWAWKFSEFILELKLSSCENMEWNPRGKRLFLRRNWVSSWFGIWSYGDRANIPNVKDTSGVELVQ